MNRLSSLLAIFLLVTGCDNSGKNRDSAAPSQSEIPEDVNPISMIEPDYEIADIYTDMRAQVLSLDKELIGDLASSPVWAVLMETGYPEAAVTLVAVVDGTASLYFSNGGGIIGAGEHENVRPASQKLVAMAGAFVDSMEVVDSFPLVTPRITTFYIITPSGVHTYSAKEVDLGEERDRFSPLFHQGHELIGQMRIADGKRQAEIDAADQLRARGESKPK